VSPDALYEAALPSLRKQWAQRTLPPHTLRPLVIDGRLLPDGKAIAAVTSTDLALQYLERVRATARGLYPFLRERIRLPLQPGTWPSTTVVFWQEDGFHDVHFVPPETP
jgi:hypothetical protein